MCHWILGLACVLLVTVSSERESIEDLRPYTFSFTNPSTLNFQDIYTSIVTSSEDTSKTALPDDERSTTTDEIGYMLQDKTFVEFRPEVTTESETRSPPRYILNSTFFQQKAKRKKITTTTEEPDDMIKVVPMKNIERGVLDLLFPESRVKAFKNIFDTVRKMLSHTFRR